MRIHVDFFFLRLDFLHTEHFALVSAVVVLTFVSSSFRLLCSASTRHTQLPSKLSPGRAFPQASEGPQPCESVSRPVRSSLTTGCG